MLTDIEIAQSAKMLPAAQIAAELGIDCEQIEPYGKYIAKLSDELYESLKSRQDGKLVLVTAINPTPAGEGKTTTTVGLGQAMKKIGKKAVIALREPSLGPVFGIKGGAAGGGYAQVVPMEEINLHFTGDMHAITAANNLLCAVIDNHLQQGNELGIDQRRILFKRCMDMNDRALRFVNVGLGGKVNGVPREDSFLITVASEIMAILCLAENIDDLKDRLGRILVAYTYDNRPVFAKDLGCVGAMALLLKHAIKPNLVQTLEGTPAFIHGGPFANIAHGCNSVRATRLSMSLMDYTVTEAGFGADLGAEKFLDIKCRAAGIKPDAVVMVATVRALKMHGGLAKSELAREDTAALARGIPNLLRHAANIREVYRLPGVVALNRFPTDTDAEVKLVLDECRRLGIKAVLSDAWACGGAGAEELAREVVRICDEGSGDFRFAYESEMSIPEKINAVVTKVYRGAGIELTSQAKKQLAVLEEQGFGNLPVCIAKTQYSFSDDPEKLCAPEGFTVTVRSLRVSAGAGFVVALTGDILTMPGLPKHPAAENIDVDENGNITGLF